MVTKFKFSALALSLALVLPAISNATDSHREDALDTVYTLSNGIDKNEVLTFQRDAKGKMVATGRVATGGTGTGSGLGNQGALTFSQDGDFLFAVNPGSNDVSVFSVKKNGQLTLVDRADDHGLKPISITVDRNRVFVVNAGDDTIFGYKFDRKQRKLEPLPLTLKRLSSTGVGPAQISFDNEGEVLTVTEKATNKITTFSIDEDSNVPSEGVSFDSAGATPFGFASGKRNQIFVSEAHGGAAGASSVSSYKVQENGVLKLINTATAAGQTAACWVVTTPNGRIAYTTNTGSGTVSSFSIKSNGELSLLQANAAEVKGALDIAISNDGNVLYVLSNGDHNIVAYNINRNGALTKIANLGVLPIGDTGLVVR